MSRIEDLERLAEAWEARAETATEKDRQAFLQLARLYRDLIARLTTREEPSAPD